MRILDLAQHIDRVAIADAPHRRDEIAEAVDRQQRRAFEWRNKEAARKMGAMMLDVVKTRAQLLFRHTKHTREFVFQIPHSCRVAESILNLRSCETRNTRRCKEYFLVQMRRWISGDSDVVQIIEPNACLFKTVTNRLLGKSGRMLEAIEALFFSRGDQAAILDDRRRRIPVISVDS